MTESEKKILRQIYDEQGQRLIVASGGACKIGDVIDDGQTSQDEEVWPLRVIGRADQTDYIGQMMLYKDITGKPAVPFQPDDYFYVVEPVDP